MTITRVIASVAIAFAAIAGSSAPAFASPIQEDDPGWSCVDDGNRICGPSNSNGVPAGCYDDGGVMVAAWPCHLVVNPDGSADIYTGFTPGSDMDLGA